MAFDDGYDPGPRIAKAATINLGVVDLERSLGFFRDLLGMEEVARVGDVAYLRGYQELGHHSLVLTRREQPEVLGYGFRVQRPEDVERFARRYAQAGIEVLEVPSGQELGRGTAIRFLTPFSEHPFEFFYELEKPLAPEALRSKLPSNSSRRRGLGARRIDHFNIQTDPGTMNQAEQWFGEAMGLRRREYIMMPDHPTTLMASWMSVTSQMHDVALGVNRDELRGRLHHVAFNLENYHDLLTAADQMADLDIEWGVGPGKHGVGQAMYLYVHDPGSGHRIELYSGGYQIFDPDWEPIRWEPDAIPYGMTWYGPAIDIRPGSRGRATTPSVGLRAESRAEPSVAGGGDDVLFDRG